MVKRRRGGSLHDCPRAFKLGWMGVPRLGCLHLWLCGGFCSDRESCCGCCRSWWGPGIVRFGVGVLSHCFLHLLVDASPYLHFLEVAVEDGLVVLVTRKCACEVLHLLSVQ